MSEDIMKKSLIIIIFALLAFGGCSGDSPVNPVGLDDFIGNWFMEGTLQLDLDGRQYTQYFGRSVFIRDDGYVTDELGALYDIKFENQVLTLTRDGVFNGHDPYCGFYDGGTMLTFEFPAFNPFFNLAYHGVASGDTAVYTQYCNYKPMIITGTVVMQRMPSIS
jgi:hypothetical protein